jgi:hypothetical protein
MKWNENEEDECEEVQTGAWFWGRANINQNRDTI